MIEARAPGKLVLCGEYAVLGGAPAIAFAMPVYACARVMPGDAPDSRLSIAGGGHWSFRWREGLPLWREAPGGGQGGILESVAATLVEAGLVPERPMALELDTHEFMHGDPAAGGVKLGLGSSAALTVALTAALLTEVSGPGATREDMLRLAQRAHRRFQGGTGSGIDVVTAVHGGVVLLAGGAANAVSLRWPDALAWLAVWSGESASTPALLARLDAFRSRAGGEYARHMAHLTAAASAVASAWQADDVNAILQGLADYDAGLRALDAGAGIGIWTARHEELARLARAAGAVYKVSGAGGGDFGVAFADSAQTIATLAARFAAHGAKVLQPVAAAAGVEITTVRTAFAR